MDEEGGRCQVTYFILAIPAEEHVAATLRGLPAWCEVVVDNGMLETQSARDVGEEEVSTQNRGLGRAAATPEQSGIFGTACLLSYFVPSFPSMNMHSKRYAINCCVAFMCV